MRAACAPRESKHRPARRTQIDSPSFLAGLLPFRYFVSSLAILGALTPDDYDHSVRLPNPPADCDVYGIQLDDVQWYIKFYTDVDVDPPHDGFLQVVSFHKERSTFTLEARRKLVLQ